MTWRFAALLGLVVVSSCKSDKEGAPGRVDPWTTSEGICGYWAEAACNDDVVDACVGSVTATDSCVFAQDTFCHEVLRGDGFDRGLAQDCVDVVDEAYVDAKITSDELEEVVLFDSGPCKELADMSIEGTGGVGNQVVPKEAGSRCDPSTDVCVETTYCDVEVEYCVLKADVGEFCCRNEENVIAPTCGPDREEVPCKPGTLCGRDGFCVALGTTGDECFVKEECAPGYFCNADQTCQALGKQNDTCETDEQCARGFFCVTTINQCRDSITLGTGAPLCEYLGG